VIVCLSPGVNENDPGRFPFTRIRPGLRLRPAAAPPPVPA
jgi:hypothetical protein